MTTLQWDQVGDRRYETGVDRGVLFLLDGTAVPWNGLTGVEENTAQEVKAYYMDGVKFLETHIPGDFTGVLKAFTYPEEFNELIGIKTAHPGIRYHDQKPQAFHLCYRTKVGNDVDGDEFGYKIHILYNIVAVPDTRSFATLTDTPGISEFTWQISGVPSVGIQGFKPTIHVTIESYNSYPFQLEDLENLLYGTDTEDPSLPSLAELTELFQDYAELTIVDNGDGTWTAYDVGDNYIVDDGDADPTTFQIDNAEVVVVDEDTYTISDTNEDP